MTEKKGELRRVTPPDLDKEKRAIKWWARMRSDGTADEQKTVNKICKELKEVRQRNGKDFNQLSRTLGITVTTLSSLELGWLDKDELKQFILPWLQALGLSPEQIESYLSRIPK